MKILAIYVCIVLLFNGVSADNVIADNSSSTNSCDSLSSLASVLHNNSTTNVLSLMKAFYPTRTPGATFLRIMYQFENKQGTLDGCNVTYLWAKGGFMLIQPPSILQFTSLFFSHLTAHHSQLNLTLPYPCKYLVTKNLSSTKCSCGPEEDNLLDILTHQTFYDTSKKMDLRWLGLVSLLFHLKRADTQLCDGVADNFVPPAKLQEFERTGEGILLPTDDIRFTEWIFPNHLRFGCDARIVGWEFAAEPMVERLVRLPQWSIYRNNSVTLANELDFLVIARSGGRFDELSRLQQEGLYRYTLQTPVEVQRGDLLGVSYSIGRRQMQLLFRNASSEVLSYRRKLTGSSVFNANNRLIVQSDSQHLPLVTPILEGDILPSSSVTIQSSDITPSSTSIFEPITSLQPTMTAETQTTITSQPQPTATPEPPTTTTAAATTTTTATTTLEPPMITMTPPLPSTSEPLPATTPQPTTTEESITATTDLTTTGNTPKTVTSPATTNEPVTVFTTIPPATSFPVKLEIIVGIVAGVLAVVLVMAVLVISVLLVMRKRKHDFKIQESDYIAPLDNPMYQVNTGTLDEDSKHPPRADPVYATLAPDKHQLAHSNGSSSPTTASHKAMAAANGNSQQQQQQQQQQQGFETSGYESSCNSHQFDPSLVYYEVGPTRTDELRVPQDYAVPVSSVGVAGEFQPYEVPVPSLRASKVTTHEYKEVLEAGIYYVPTIGEREQYLSRVESERSCLLDESIYCKMSQNYREQLHSAAFFLEADVYWRPASSKRDLYDQLSKRKYREILRQQIQIKKHLGSGQFGLVNMGEWSQSSGVTDVAVKTLRPQSSDEEKVKFLQEAAIMGQFLHPNVVRLYGVVTVGEPVMIVIEYMEKGDLRKYLLEKRPKHEKEPIDKNLPHLLLRFCREIADGMEYLSNKSFVHRDLAARNVLIGSDGVCKIGDFGMSRNLEDSNYYITHGGKIPVKWTAPEALNFMKYSTASDVWSFGAVMYETWSLGVKPFDGYSNNQTMDLVARGFRLPPPPGCPRPLYELMIRCWHAEPVRRPGFSAIKTVLSHSDSHLLSWSPKDLSVHPQVMCLGASRAVADKLYQDLQDYYLKK